MIRPFESLYEMMQVFGDEQACIDHLRAIRWKDGAFCPYCGSTKVYHFSDQRNHKCGDCRARFSIKVGTIFEDSKLPLRKWFMAIFLITSHKKGIASTQLAKDLGVTQKTAWFVLHRLRYAARTKSFNRPLEGTVEVDETYVGGKEKNKHAHKRDGDKRGGKGKIAVVGMLERDGELRTKKVERIDGHTLCDEIGTNVAPGSIVMTDEHRGYIGIEKAYHGDTEAEKAAAIVEAAFEPKLFGELRDRGWADAPHEGAIRSYLVKSHFTDAALQPAIRAFVETCQYVAQFQENDSDGPAPSQVGDSMRDQSLIRREGAQLAMRHNAFPEVPEKLERPTTAAQGPQFHNISRGVILLGGSVRDKADAKYVIDYMTAMMLMLPEPKASEAHDEIAD